MLRHKRGIASFALLVMLLCALIFARADESEAARKKKHYDDWRGVAADMALEFNAAIQTSIKTHITTSMMHTSSITRCRE